MKEKANRRKKGDKEDRGKKDGEKECTEGEMRKRMHRGLKALREIKIT